MNKASLPKWHKKTDVKLLKRFLPIKQLIQLGEFRTFKQYWNIL